MDDNHIPVIVGVGELVDRPASPDKGLEPIKLMAQALRLAERDAGASLLAHLDAIDIINEISWPYPDPCALLRAELGGDGDITCTYHPVGGQTPMLAIHQAALAIQQGRWRVAALCGAEAQSTVTAAQRAGIELPWAPRIEDFVPVRGGTYQQPIARTLDFATPTHVYPFYEAATRAAWGQSFAEAQAESGRIWANNAAVARTREAGWIRREISPEAVITPSIDNRLIAWPYTKLMSANPGVNQGAAVLMCSLAFARETGVPEGQLIHVHGGAAADEPRDYLARTTYARSPAMEWVLDHAKGLAGTEGFAATELYSCFPVVPKMARRTLGLSDEAPLSVAGGLTFFGAPLNNYMTHAAVAMVQRLREQGGRGLLYAQGEYVTKHHALVVGRQPLGVPLAESYRRPEETALMVMAQDHQGPARADSATLLYDRHGNVRHGGVILTTPTGQRQLARVAPDDAATVAAIRSDRGVVGMTGSVSLDGDAIAHWTIAS